MHPSQWKRSSWQLAALLATVLVASCTPATDQKKPAPPVPDTSVEQSQLVGKYQVAVESNEESTTTNESVATLNLTKDGTYSLKIDSETISGSFTFEAGVLSLKSPGEDPPQKFIVQDSGKKLVEQTDQDPLTWIREDSK